MIEIRNKQILVDGRPRLILSGEIHYFRLPRGDWQDRLDKLKQAGCNAVSSYVPWLCHEPVEGRIDLEGHTRPELDLGAFIDLCRDNGLWFQVKPGPFVMAEMKNEGLPYWLYSRYPEIVPVGWDGVPAPTRTVDYLAPNFLKAAEKWYEAVMRVIAPRLHGNGGNVIALQLDNEVGMLAWCSNSPDLTEPMLEDFARWLRERYGKEALADRYPFDPSDPAVRAAAIRSPDEGYAARLMRDLGHFMRGRFARYVALLRSWAEAFGVRDIPFQVNIHGTGGGRGFTFPIGISQLYEAYSQDDGYLAGTDYYLGNLSCDNFQDLYLCNAFTEATQPPDQPLASLEFECGDGDYGDLFGNRYDPSAADFKLRMCIAQGHRLINFYLFAGGYNYLLSPEPDDGDGRIAITGERHGVAAPVKPDGSLSYTLPRMARAIETVAAVAGKLATMREERDKVAVGFIPDYYMTEYCHPNSAVMRGIAENLQANRCYGAWETMIRAMLLTGYRFGALDIQNQPLTPETAPVLVLPSARYMAAELQEKLADWLHQGGKLLLYGELPEYDMEGNECVGLAAALGVNISGRERSGGTTYLSLVPQGWAARIRPRTAEIRTHFAQTFASGRAEPLLSLHGSGAVAGFETPVGRGRAIVIATACPCDRDLFRTALERLGATAGLRHDCPEYGIFMTSTANDAGERFLHLINLEGFDKLFHISLNDARLLDGRRFCLRARDAVMLPFNVGFDDIRIRYSTAEILDVTADAIEFRLTQPQDIIVLETERSCLGSEDYFIDARDGIKRIVPRHPGPDQRLRVVFGRRS
jgi:beta-galactosidase